MNDAQAFIEPSKIALALIGRGVAGAAPLIVGTAAIIAAGSIYGVVKASGAVKKEIDKPRPGENKATKLVKSGVPIKSSRQTHE